MNQCCILHISCCYFDPTHLFLPSHWHLALVDLELDLKAEPSKITHGVCDLRPAVVCWLPKASSHWMTLKNVVLRGEPFVLEWKGGMRTGRP